MTVVVGTKFTNPSPFSNCVMLSKSLNLSEHWLNHLHQTDGNNTSHPPLGLSWRGNGTIKVKHLTQFLAHWEPLLNAWPWLLFCIILHMEFGIFEKQCSGGCLLLKDEVKFLLFKSFDKHGLHWCQSPGLNDKEKKLQFHLIWGDYFY